jgi:acetyltransferase
MLSEAEAKALLAAYGIPVVETGIARTVEDAVGLAQKIGFPVAIKILSPDISHKSDVGGVVLDLESPEAVRFAADSMHRRVHGLRPSARLDGFTVQAMARRADTSELIVGVATDPVFGPVILFGQGGTAVEVMADRAIALPPLNTVLARDLVSRTRVAKLLAGYRNTPAADMEAISRTLIQVSRLVVDIPELVELDINPLLANAQGVIALDARIRVQPAREVGVGRLAIRPYPQELEERIEWQGESLLLRPIKPEDAPQHVEFFNALDQEDIRYRIFTRLRELQPSQLARLTQIDYDREMALIAVRERPSHKPETLGVVRVIADPDNISAEFAIIVRSDLKGQGLGRILMKQVIDYCRRRGMQEIVGEALSHNRRVIDLVKPFGFEVSPMHEDGETLRLRLDLSRQRESIPH